MKKLILVSLLVALLASACYNEGQLVVNPAPLTQYMFQPTESKLRDVAKAYAEAINYNLEKGTLHPGLYADYGVALARLGCIEQANVMFNNEKVFFPNSTAYVDYLISVLTPGMKAVSHIDTSHINIKTLDTIKVTLTPEEEAFQRQLDNDPEYQRLLKQQMKEEKEQKALETKKAKAEMAKAKEAERKAKAKAKEKAQKEKAAARRRPKRLANRQPKKPRRPRKKQPKPRRKRPKQLPKPRKKQKTRKGNQKKPKNRLSL